MVRKQENNRWYKRWELLAAMIKRGETEEVMRSVFAYMNYHKCFGYRWIASSAAKDLETVIDRCLKTECDKCPHRFKCLTD